MHTPKRSSPDSIAVEVAYEYRLQTPLADLLEMVGGEFAATIDLVDNTVMAMNPTD